MSLLGGNRVPLNITYILSSILPFSWDSDTGDISLGLHFEPVPLPFLYINCGLVQGEVAMRICSVVPVRGILGNGLTGSWLLP